MYQTPVFSSLPLGNLDHESKFTIPISTRESIQPAALTCNSKKATPTIMLKIKLKKNKKQAGDTYVEPPW